MFTFSVFCFLEHMHVPYFAHFIMCYKFQLVHVVSISSHAYILNQL